MRGANKFGVQNTFDDPPEFPMKGFASNNLQATEGTCADSAPAVRSKKICCVRWTGSLSAGRSIVRPSQSLESDGKLAETPSKNLKCALRVQGREWSYLL